MGNTYTVKIDEREYVLDSADLESLKWSSEQVNLQFDELKKIYKGESFTTYSVLAALNLAEKINQNVRQNDINTNYMKSQMNKMIEYINKNF